MAAAGTSTMMPNATLSAIATRASRRRCDSASMRAFTASTSSRAVTIGTRIRTGPKAEARSIAHSWVSSSVGRDKDSRTPRRPSAGFGSFGKVRPLLSALSAPRSRVRKVIGRPAMPRTASR